MDQAYKRCERLDKSNRLIDDLPEELEALETHIADDEASLGDVGENMDKRIVWADPENKTKTDLALVYIHGFSAIRQETVPLSEQLAGDLQANLFETRLSGHGRGPDGMCDAGAVNLIEDGKEALAVARRIGRRSVLICTSTGAAIALYLAADGYKLQPDAMVLISPNFWPRSRAARIISWRAMRGLALRISGGYHHWKPANAQQEK